MMSFEKWLKTIWLLSRNEDIMTWYIGAAIIVIGMGLFLAMAYFLLEWISSKRGRK